MSQALLRHAVETDLPRIVAIYNSTVPTRQSTADTVPVSVASRQAWFDRHTPDRRPILVHETHDTIDGWVSFESFYGRPAYAHTAEISIYVAPEARGRGLGRRLLEDAIRRSPELGIRTLVAFVFSHNTPSIGLFLGCGFNCWGELPGVAEMDGREYGVSIYGLRIGS